MKPYNDYNTYLKNRYGTKVYKIGIDAGFTCPNRCIYCDGNGSRSPYTGSGLPIRAQLEERIRYLKEKKGAKKFIAYFQAFTNTYAPAEKLKKVYDEILTFKDIVGLSIGTRPDTVDEKKLALISSYKEKYEVWIEYGLQSSHDRTLKLIKRGHTYKDFVEASKMAASLGILVCAHVIIGLPGETKDDVVETAKRISSLKINGVKIHVLHVLRNSQLEKMYAERKVSVLSLDQYAELACDFLENLSPEIIMQRLTGQGTRESHIAPDWALDKAATLKRIEEVFMKRKSYQGSILPFHL